MWRNSGWWLGYCLISVLLGCGKSPQTPSSTRSSVIFPLSASLPAELPLPRYRFQVGQHLTYRLTDSIDLMPEEDQDPDPPSEYQWDVYVTDKNDDGSWRLFIRYQVKLNRKSHEGELDVRFQNDVIGYCDIHPDGHFFKNDTLQERSMFKVDPEHLFLPLPVDRDECRDGWTRQSPIGEQTRHLSVTALQDGVMTFAGTVSSPSDVNYKQNVIQKVNFDLQRGLPTAIARESKADWSVNPWHSRTVRELISVRNVSNEWLKQFRKEAQRFSEVASEWWKLYFRKELARSRTECESLLTEARELLTNAEAETTLEEIIEPYKALIIVHDREAEWALDKAARRETLYAMDALDWETTDFQDNTRRLDDFRGQVVLLDFWYRGCGHCIDAIPTIKRLVEKYQDEDVAVLGMNKDRNDSDALYVIQKFELEYPTLRGQEISKQYQVQGWPTFIVLDQSGKIAEIVEGNSEGLYDQLDSAIARLLEQTLENED